MRQSSLFVPLFLIVVGALWFLRSMEWFPETSVIIAFALMAGGLLVLILDGINKQSIVSGPFMMYIGAAIYASYEYGYETNVIFALGMMVLGVLLLLSRSNAVPLKRPRALPPQERDY
ncbi:hypothetical protein ACKLNO_04445 [Neisseriaceae bacterium B1]